MDGGSADAIGFTLLGEVSLRYLTLIWLIWRECSRRFTIYQYAGLYIIGATTRASFGCQQIQPFTEYALCRIDSLLNTVTSASIKIIGKLKRHELSRGKVSCQMNTQYQIRGNTRARIRDSRVKTSPCLVRVTVSLWLNCITYMRQRLRVLSDPPIIRQVKRSLCSGHRGIPPSKQFNARHRIHTFF